MKARLILLLILTVTILSSCTFQHGFINDGPLVTTKEEQTSEPTQTTETTTVPITTQPITTTTEAAPSENKVDLSEVLAQSSFVYDVTKGELLAACGYDNLINPASITKLLTIQYALTLAPEDLEITPHSDELAMVGEGSSVAYVKTNHRLTVAQLIKGMMLPSGNDAAYVLAAGVVRYANNDPDMSAEDAIRLFVNGMNEYAKGLGCTNTRFTVPDGLAEDEHYTSIHDLVIIGKNALNCKLITDYSKIVSENVKYASGHTITWNNTNRLIDPEDKYYSPYVTGLKTGSLTDNYCLYISAEINGSTYLIGIFTSPTKTSRYEDAHIIINSILALND